MPFRPPLRVKISGVRDTGNEALGAERKRSRCNETKRCEEIDIRKFQIQVRVMREERCSEHPDNAPLHTCTAKGHDTIHNKSRKSMSSLTGSLAHRCPRARCHRCPRARSLTGSLAHGNPTPYNQVPSRSIINRLPRAGPVGSSTFCDNIHGRQTVQEDAIPH